MICGIAIAAGCGAEPEQHAALAIVPQPTVEWAGCLEIDEGVCVIADDRTLTVWIDTPSASRVEVLGDDQPLERLQAPVEGGLQLSVDLPPDTANVAIRGVDPRWSQAWSLPVRGEHAPAALTEALDLLGSGQTGLAADALQRAKPGASAFTLARIEKATCDLDVKRRRHLPGADCLTAAAKRARRQGLPVLEARSLATAAFLDARWNAKVERATAAVQRLAEMGATLPPARVWAEYQAGVVARAVFDPTGALQHFEAAARFAARLQMDRELSGALQSLGLDLALLGRLEEAEDVARRAAELDLSPKIRCSDRLALYGNAGWDRLLLADAGLSDASPRPYLKRNLALSRECGNAWADANRGINFALTEILEEHPDRAFGWLAEIGELPPELADWAEETWAEAAVDSSRWDLAPALVIEPAFSADPLLRWKSLVRRAELLDRWGYGAQAIESYRDAEALLDDRVLAAGIDDGRELLLAGRQASMHGAVSLLLEAGEVQEAQCRARLARRRSLAHVDRPVRVAGLDPETRKRWTQDVTTIRSGLDRVSAQRRELWRLSATTAAHQRAKLDEEAAALHRRLSAAMEAGGLKPVPRTCEELDGPRLGELMLLIVPLADDWVVFASDTQGTTPITLGGDELFDGTGAWLTELAEPLARAQRLRVVPTQRSWAVPFHRLPWRDGLLMDLAPIEYGVDLRRPPPSTRGPTALVVADPSSNLPHAKAEAQAVLERLRAGHWEARLLDSEDASRSGITAALGEVAILHYAGHGVYAGASGWDSALLLRDHEQLGVREILALTAVPDGVVLVGCDTGRNNLFTLEGGMNVGRAFLLAGTRWALVADRPVPDDLAGRVGAALYDPPFLSADGIDAADALRHVQRELRAGAEADDWASFRVLTR